MIGSDRRAAGARQTPIAATLVGARRTLSLAEPAIMGVLNVTPDSFSDGGRYADKAAAIERGLEMVDQGAAIVDIGGESTRPRSEPVPAPTQAARVLPVVEALAARGDVFVSVDTRKPEIMRDACAAGADMINDVGALRAPGALETVAASGAAVCLMHMQGEPRTMQNAPSYADVVADIEAFLGARIAACEAAGIGRYRLCIDPGFGFGKTLAHNLALLRNLGRFTGHGCALMLGVSRKSMFARLAQRDDKRAKINASLAAAFWAVGQGARIIRTHDVRDTRDVLGLARALARETEDNT